MAQPGNFTPILLYGSSTPTNVPLAANLTNSSTGSEIAINVADKNLFFKDSGGVVNIVPIRQSSTSSNGWLSNTDWNTFNSKAPATSGTSLLYGNGSGGFSNVTIGSGISFAGGTLSATGTGGTVTSVAALTLGTTGTDLSSTVANGTTTPVITLNVPTASAANRGALSSIDWSTFNGKQAALVSGTNIKTVSGTSLLGSGDLGTIGSTYGGTGQSTYAVGDLLVGGATNTLTKFADVATGNALISGGVGAAPSYGKIGLTTHISGTLSVGNGGTGLTTLATGLIPFGNGTSAFNNSTNLYFDGTSLGIGTGVVALGNKLVIGAGNVQTDPGYGLLQKNTYYGFYPNDNVAGMKISTNGLLNIYTGGTGTTLTATFQASGGVSIGNTTDPGASNLSVSGVVKTLVTTVAGLPSASTVGAGSRAFVTNALSPVFGSAVIGGGSVNVPVYSTGSAWFVG